MLAVTVHVGGALSYGVADGVTEGVEGAADADGDAGGPDGGGVAIGALLVAAVQPTTNRLTTIAVTVREIEGRIGFPRDCVSAETFGGGACYFDLLAPVAAGWRAVS